MTHLKQQEILRLLGFIRVDGLTTLSGKTISAYPVHYGRWDINTYGLNQTRIVTLTGEVWIACKVITSKDIPVEIIPRGLWALVPPGINDLFKIDDLKARIKNSDYTPNLT